MNRVFPDHSVTRCFSADYHILCRLEANETGDIEYKIIRHIDVPEILDFDSLEDFYEYIQNNCKDALEYLLEKDQWLYNELYVTGMIDKDGDWIDVKDRVRVEFESESE